MDLDDILAKVPIDDIAEKFGVSQDEARQAVKEGGAVLLGGLAKNAETEEGSAAIEKALSKHGSFTGASKVDDVDQTDGQKIITHVFGDDSKKVTDTLTKEPKTAGIDFAKLLPILAPIVMGLVANAGKGAAPAASGGTAGGIGDLLGGLLGGGNSDNTTGSGSAGGGIGDLLGGLLGGGNSGNGGGGLDIGGLLGGLFGGKK